MSPEKVLIVEDEPITLQALGMIVSSLGFEPVTATMAEDGLVLARQQPAPVAALVDLKLRGSAYDGLELIRRLREDSDQRGESLRIVAHTASVSRENQVAAQAAGADGMILKPFRARDVAAALEGLGP